ncbi:sugar ABC transporter permease [Rhodococcus sp. 06-462-5]|uniref:ABC transporter permease n=1 Tax=unclassified Rhodococcus (in: high G+C Gram-positive bacteria) TaxID=192944 RepID=UPI000B9ABB53|nr:MULTISPECIES: ABC transporter permease [unclassified Rhodococcus (in: high G+C Gram-positive bacteria)]OZC74327.1 sugar ABC transporter permease [Rhodococcus sp. 06-462-5]OZE65110.1 sugar ABC transporter permease [Rhodococcus sp. 02-925g]
MSNQIITPSIEPLPPSEKPSKHTFDLVESVRNLARVQVFQIVLVLAAICIVFSIMAPGSFPEWGNIRQIIQNVSILAVLGIGMTFVIVTSGIDLSVGSVLVFSGVVSAKTMAAVGGDGWGVAAIGIVVALGCGLCWGLLNGFLIGKANVPPLIVTLGTLGGALGLSQVITGGVDIRDVPPVLVDTIGYGNLPSTTIPLISSIALVLVVIFGIVLHRTKFGLYTFAVGSKEQSARRVGIKVDMHLVKIYALSGTLAGLAGILSLSQYGTTAIAGQSQTNLNVIAAVVIGGTSLFGGIGTMFGTVVGLFIPAVLQNGFVIVGVQPFWQQVAVGAVLIAAVYFDQRRRDAASRGQSPSSLKKLWSRSP